jgi:hypothetical protein
LIQVVGQATNAMHHGIQFVQESTLKNTPTAIGAYVTGAHAFKFGYNGAQFVGAQDRPHAALSYRFNVVSVPNS